MSEPVLFNRREFVCGAAAGVAAGLPALASSSLLAGASQAVTRPDVAAIYFPSWHRYDHMDAWRGPGWTEWELVKTAPARFAGHHQPLRPTWGFFDESDPPWSAREIDMAADHGIDVFLFDWYWYSGVRLMEEALEQGFLKAPNRARMKFALMWANHNWGDYFPVPYDKPQPSWLPQRHTANDLQRLIEYGIAHYFQEPNYWTVAGRLFFSVFQPQQLIEQLGGAAATKSLLATIDHKLDRAKLPPMHWNAMTWKPEVVALYAEAGFHSTTTYNITSTGKTSPEGTQDYQDLIRAHSDHWKAMAATTLPHCPMVTMGWDVTPRCEHQVPFPFAKAKYPYGPVVVGNTPERFGRLCKLAAEFAAASAANPPAIVVNAWNEWTEGSHLLPEEKYGTAYLEAASAAFGKRQ